jgi:hypothetical protein
MFHSEPDEPYSVTPLDEWYNRHYGSLQHTANEYPGEVLYKGRPIMNWIGSWLDSLIYEFGPPDVDGIVWEGGTYGYAYGNWEVVFVKAYAGDYIDFIYGCPAAITVDGATLDKNRGGLVGIFGNPEYEGWEEDYGGETYYMLFSYQGPYYVLFDLLFELDDPNGKAYQFWIFYATD